LSTYWPIIDRHFEKATALLATGDDDDLIYACLELRKCLEAYAYDMLHGYLSEGPMRVVETWQPDKVLKELLAIDPLSATSAVIRMQSEASETRPAGAWKFVGEDRRLAVDYLRKNYQALGSFLHVPTIRQSSERPNPAGRSRTSHRSSSGFVKTIGSGSRHCLFRKGLTSL
jgi:hypothetical protein